MSAMKTELENAARSLLADIGIPATDDALDWAEERILSSAG